MENEQRTFDPTRRKTGFALRLYDLRWNRLRLTQRGFAERYNLGQRTIRDLEQGVSNPTPAMRLIVAAIDRDPAWMQEAAKMVVQSNAQ